MEKNKKTMTGDKKTATHAKPESTKDSKASNQKTDGNAKTDDKKKNSRNK